MEHLKILVFMGTLEPTTCGYWEMTVFSLCWSPQSLSSECHPILCDLSKLWHEELNAAMCHCACMHAQLCPTLRDPMDGSLPCSSVHEILQVRILEWAAMPSSRGSSWPMDQTHVSYVFCIAGGFFTTEPTWQAHSVIVYVINCTEGKRLLWIRSRGRYINLLRCSSLTFKRVLMISHSILRKIISETTHTIQAIENININI